MNRTVRTQIVLQLGKQSKTQFDAELKEAIDHAVYLLNNKNCSVYKINIIITKPETKK